MTILLLLVVIAIICIAGAVESTPSVLPTPPPAPIAHVITVKPQQNPAPDVKVKVTEHSFSLAKKLVPGVALHAAVKEPVQEVPVSEPETVLPDPPAPEIDSAPIPSGDGGAIVDLDVDPSELLEGLLELLCSCLLTAT